MPNKTDKFLWTFKSGNKIQNWPISDAQRYITQPTVLFPKEFLQHKNIQVPKKLPMNIMDNVGILASALSKHGNKYFVSHMGEEFITFFVMLSGSYCAKVGNKTYEIDKNMCFMLPANTPCDYFTRGKKFELIWFHIKDTPEWETTFGKQTICRNMKNFDNFFSAYKLYSDEIYQRNPSLIYLQNALNILLEIFKREFCAGEENPEFKKYQELANRVAKNLSENWTTQKVAKMLNSTTPVVNANFQGIYSTTFPKYVLRLRMDYALKMLLRGEHLSAIAEKTGFSSAFALSATFKKYFGVSPKVRKKLEGK